MQRIGPFLAGFIVGALAVFVGLKYHVVRAPDGVHLVPKQEANFSDAYVDIRSFSMQDWDNHRSLAMAIMQADKTHLLKDSAKDSLRRTLNTALESLLRPSTSSVTTKP